MTALLELNGRSLPKRLDPVSFTVEGGELVALVGPNGSGKTSLLHAVAGIGKPAGGIRVDDIDPSALPPSRRARLLAFLPASRDVIWPLRVRDMIALGGAGPEEVEAAMAAMALLPFADRRIDRLSTGERSRVLIARVLATDPRLLLLDEPTANLDPRWQLRLLEGLRERVGAGRRAVLVALHDLDAARRFATRILVMSGGRIVADGEPARIFSDSVVPEIFGVSRLAGEWRLAEEG